MEQMDYNLMFRCFVGLGMDDPVWDHSVYSKNRDRLLEADIARKFLKGILEHREVAPLLSEEHFTVDGTLVNAWASLKSFVPRENASKNPAVCRRSIRGRLGRPGQSEEGSAGRGSSFKGEVDNPRRARQNQGRHVDGEDRNERQEPQRGGQLPWAEALERNPRIDNRSRSAPSREGPGKEAKLSFMGHAMTENSIGLVVQTSFTQATRLPSVMKPRR